MLKRALLILVLMLPALAFAQAGTTPAKPAAKAPPKAAPAKQKADEAPAAETAKVTASKVLIKTNLGDMTVELYPDKAPKSVENFLTYVNSGFYDGTIFHRVIDNFMIQGGGFTRDLRQKPTRPAIANEAKNGLSNLRGQIIIAVDLRCRHFLHFVKPAPHYANVIFDNPRALLAEFMLELRPDRVEQSLLVQLRILHDRGRRKESPLECVALHAQLEVGAVGRESGDFEAGQREDANLLRDDLLARPDRQTLPCVGAALL